MSEESETSNLFGQVTVRPRLDEELVIRQATKLAGAASVAEYIVRAAVKQARWDLVNRTTFVLDPNKAEEFYVDLDCPAKPNEALKALFAQKTSFEQ